MSDGPGSVSYHYDQLSRLDSETRTINGVGSFPLNYDYNLAGELASVTDPFGAQVSYARDTAGRLSNVTGSGFANVSTYASNYQYRASGAVKHLDYGNGRTLDVGYNSRLQASSFTIPALINKTYQYQNDGRLKYSHDLLDQKFDRSYSYDQAARMTQALSGAEARGEAATSDRPYKQTMTYDAWNHLLSRDKRHWTGSGGIEYPAVNSYINNRNTVWSYDAAGNLLQTGQIPTISYQYDAAERMIHNVSDNVELTQSYDGDGQVLKRYEVDTIYEDGGSSHTETNTLYQLRSSALGGKVLTEIGAQGQKGRTYVYADGTLLAWQSVIYVNGSVTAHVAVWEHRDPSNASYRTSQQTSAHPETWAELDPFASNAGLENPYQLPTQSHKPNIFYPAFVLSSDGRCRVDSVDENCTHAGLVLRAHAGDVDPNTTSPSDAGSVGAKPIYGTFCVTVSAGGKVETECRTEVTGYTSSSSFSNNLSLLPQNSGVSQNLGDFRAAVASASQILSGDNDCSRFFKGAGLSALNTIADAVNSAGDSAFQAMANDTSTGIRMRIPSVVNRQDAPIVSADAYAAVSPSSVAINTNGAFVRSVAVGNATLPRFGGYSPGSLESRVLQLLHEAGHLTITDVRTTLRGIRVGNQTRFYSQSRLTHLLPIDSGNTPLSEANTARILAACRDQINALGNRR
jgi:YD repeat-containing protein